MTKRTLPICSLDLETVSNVDLRKAGASRYSRDKSTLATVIAWAFGDDPVQSATILDLGPRRLPDAVLRHIRDGGIIRGWNAGNFEWNMLLNYFGVPIAPEQIDDTMFRALHAGLPAALGECGPALRLPIVKDASAHRLMMQMAKPRRSSTGSVSYWHEDDPDKLARLRAYCEQDVAAERAIAKVLPELPEREQRIALLDRRSNTLGVRLDLPLVNAMIGIAQDAAREMNAACAKLTGGAVTSPGTQTAKLVAWLQSNGLSVESLRKDAVVDALQTTPEGDLRSVLALRQTAAKSSVKKLQAMLASVDDDSVVRGTIVYYGANRTGRATGRLLQIHNLPRGEIKDPNFAIEMILDGAGANDLEMLYGPPLGVVSSCIRGCIVPRPGKVFVVFDLSQIEARMIAWLAGQHDVLRVFSSGEDIYTHAARKVGSSDRNLGKILTLACGYGMGQAKFQDTAAKAPKPIQLSLEEAKAAVDAWRRVNPNIVTFWRNCETAVRSAIADFKVTRVSASVAINDKAAAEVNRSRNGSPLLTLLLPSGRRLFYRDIAIEADDNGRDGIVFSGVDQITKRWSRIRTYSGKLAENICQSAARDVLYEMMLEIEAKGLGDILFQVHDELIVEVPEEEAQRRYDAIKAVMNTTPSWAEGLPVKAEGHILKRYGK